jgi:hypothetical protein
MDFKSLAISNGAPVLLLTSSVVTPSASSRRISLPCALSTSKTHYGTK